MTAMKRRGGFTWVEMLVLLGILIVLAAILYPAFQGGHHPSPRVSCAGNLKQIGVGFMLYAQENDEHFPPLKMNNAKSVGAKNGEKRKAFGWADEIFVYVRVNEVFQCPSERQTAANTDPTQSGYTDYWFNSNLSELDLNRLASPTRTILLGDGNDGTDNANARYNRNSLPQSWRDTENSPARRHLETANYAFADGHVKSHKPQSIADAPSRQSLGTFSPR